MSQAPPVAIWQCRDPTSAEIGEVRPAARTLGLEVARPRKSGERRTSLPAFARSMAA